MGNTNKISVCICDVTSSAQELIHVSVPVGSTIKQVIERSELQNMIQQIDFTTHAVGVFGVVVDSTYVLNDHDRIELYRPLRMGPMQVRRQRAKLQR